MLISLSAGFSECCYIVVCFVGNTSISLLLWASVWVIVVTEPMYGVDFAFCRPC